MTVFAEILGNLTGNGHSIIVDRLESTLGTIPLRNLTAIAYALWVTGSAVDVLGSGGNDIVATRTIIADAGTCS
jgi:hypothetical protein